MKNIVIIGNGVAGITAARHIRKKSDHKITIISGETKYFFSRTALMYVFMGHMKFEHTQPYENWFWKKNRIDLVQSYVNNVDINTKTLKLDNGETLSYDDLIIATGSKPNKFGWPGQDLKAVTGMYSKQDLDTITEYAKDCKRAVIVGGGLIGIEMAEMLASKNIPVTFLVREASFWNGVLPAQESEMINRHIKEHHIDLRLETNLVEILGDEHGRVKAITTDKGETIECNLVGLTAGVSPNVNFLKDSGIELDRGVLVNRQLETNIPNIYAIGDCAQQHQAIGERRPIEAVWYTGRMMGETVARTICGTPSTYQPGHWFNSAKFLDIEYQTYGWIWAKPRENEARFYWEHKDGKKSIHINYDKNTKEFIGINNFGIRMRHNVFDKWLTEKRTIEHVLEHLKDANFDPEFYAQHESEIIQKFNIENGTSLVTKKKSWKRIFQKA
ncbi:NAD(P)H-nitrite reductase large subunit [Wenyingzhuangia heitensis]|uniref:NAD(P)H-nitrite reductase large subunit n=1 Tax=Wenyingzhuangia heitensis TaxID=1487859 RepID=A0ABX0U8H8_9FLAO|nr:FAD/NAD(P)-binding oxidoreductase [Wenyingzhuangia heitensis]NIJ44493.1 NAD(P)H-nitrite reductase large subunit [Wenyingzhuangia heitensis]